MPRISQARGVASIPAPGPATNPVALAPDAFDELMDGLPDEQRMIRTDRIAGDVDASQAPPAMLNDVPVDKVLVTNLRYPNEQVFIPATVLDHNGNDRQQFIGNQNVQFMEGRVMVTQDVADLIKSVSPYVHIEPADGPVMTFTQTGFETRVPAAYQEYATRWADEQ